MTLRWCGSTPDLAAPMNERPSSMLKVMPRRRPARNLPILGRPVCVRDGAVVELDDERRDHRRHRRLAGVRVPRAVLARRLAVGVGVALRVRAEVVARTARARATRRPSRAGRRPRRRARCRSSCRGSRRRPTRAPGRRAWRGDRRPAPRGARPARSPPSRSSGFGPDSDEKSADGPFHRRLRRHHLDLPDGEDLAEHDVAHAGREREEERERRDADGDAEHRQRERAARARQVLPHEREERAPVTVTPRRARRLRGARRATPPTRRALRA